MDETKERIAAIDTAIFGVVAQIEKLTQNSSSSTEKDDSTGEQQQRAYLTALTYKEAALQNE